MTYIFNRFVIFPPHIYVYTYVDECTPRHSCNDQQCVELSPEPASPGLSHCTTHTRIVSLLLEAGWRVFVAVGRETTIF